MPFHGFFFQLIRFLSTKMWKRMWMVQKTIIIIEQTILTQVVTTSVYLIWIDDDDDGGCGEVFFFFFFFYYAFVFEGKQNKKNPTQDIFYMVNARYILWILLLVVFFAFYQVTSSNLRWTECKIEYMLMMISHHLLVWITFPTLQTFD